MAKVVAHVTGPHTKQAVASQAALSKQRTQRGMAMLEAADSTLNTQKPFAAPAPGLAAARQAMEQATLGATMTVKGELSGSQAFFVDGRVEGSIHFPNHRVTIGRGAVVLATIEAKEVVIMGTVTGNIDCSERVDVRSEAVVTGDVVTQRISIDEGALVKGSVEVRKVRKGDSIEAEAKAKIDATSKPQSPPKPEVSTTPEAKPESLPKPSVTALPAAPAEAPKAAAAAAASSGTTSTFRVSGSKVLFEEKKG
jgi:cytoskeletal protein CcmA (bactofilin family)